MPASHLFDHHHFCLSPSRIAIREDRLTDALENLEPRHSYFQLGDSHSSSVIRRRKCRLKRLILSLCICSDRRRMLSLVILLFIVIALGLVTGICIYLLVQSRSSNWTHQSKHAVKYSIGPSIDIVTHKLHRLSFSSVISRRSSMLSPLATTMNVPIQPIHRRQSSIIDSKQIAQIEFSLPKPSETFRRRSVAICHNLLECPASTIDSIIASIKSSTQFLPCLLSFSVIYSPISTTELKIVFHSLMPLPIDLVLQQLTIKIKLLPDGKIKSLQLKKLLDKEKIFDEHNEYALRFHGVSANKLNDKALLLKLTGKDQQKKSVTLGQVGKIEFNQFQGFIDNPRLDFVQEIEKIKLVSPVKKLFFDILSSLVFDRTSRFSGRKYR